MTTAPPTPTDTLITDLRFDLVTNPDGAAKRAHLGEHVADHVTSAVLLATPADAALAGHVLVQLASALARVACGDADGLQVCPHAALLADVAGYAGLTLVDRAQAAAA
jgi:hypothetical protein